MKPEDCILYSGAAAGAEAAFGAAAEAHGVDEVNFTFEGHNDARQRGIRVLTHEELKHGDVSLAYVSKLMNRSYRDTPLFKKVLQTIWHQVNNGQEIYVVGKILGRRHREGRHRLGRRVREALQQAAVRLRPGPGRLVPLGRRELRDGEGSRDPPPALLRDGHALPRRERRHRDPGPSRPHLPLTELYAAHERGKCA